MQGFSFLLRRFGRDESGVFAVIFGLMAIVLVALSGAVVDYVSLEQARNRAQIALDAAALALQPEITKRDYNEEEIRKRAEALVIVQIGSAEMSAKVDQIRVDQNRGSLFLSGSFTTPTNFVRLVGVEELSASFSSEAVRGSLDIEVAVALDITGSMSGTRIRDLKAAATSFIETLIQGDQNQNYTRMALVPYSQAVNVSPHQDQIRGAQRDSKSVSSMEWSSGEARHVSKAVGSGSEVTITSAGHGFSQNDWVYVWNLNGFGSTNNRAFQITDVTTNSFRLVGSNGSGDKKQYSAKVIECVAANCDVSVNSARHGYEDGQYLHITDVVGMTSLNGNTYQVDKATRDTLVLLGSTAGGNVDRRTHTANTGRLHCTWQTTANPCTYYRFPNLEGGWKTLPLSNCVTERTVNAATDKKFTETYAGRNYPASNNPCIANAIVPLTDNKTALRNAITALEIEGSTAGELGIAWAWHMLSPNLGYLWPEDENRPASYDEPNLLKAAIIMTDGDFNTVHCNGVVARNSTGGGSSGSNSDKINCDAPNGDAYTQARAYCDAMKATEKIVIFTVGFGIAKGSNAAKLLTYCASGSQNAFLTNDGSQLNSAFQTIADGISALRIAQ